MVEKKTTTKKTNTKKIDFEKKIEDVKENTSQTAEKIKNKSEQIFSQVGDWRLKATDEEKIFIVLGIVLLLIGLYVLRGILLGIVLTVLGILFVSGFFISKKK